MECNLWLNRDYVGGLNQINRMKLVMTESDLGLYKREKEEAPTKVYWSQDQGRYESISSSKKNKLLCQTEEIEEDKIKTTKVKISKEKSDIIAKTTAKKKIIK